MIKSVDSYRFISGITKRMIKSWINMERPREIPWKPLAKPLANCTVSLISSAGLALKTDKPFDQERERRNPWWGDPSYRILPATATSQDVRYYHLHIDPSYAEQDLNCLFPLQLLQKLVYYGRHPATGAAPCRERARPHSQPQGGFCRCRGFGACLTDLLLVRRTGTA